MKGDVTLPEGLTLKGAALTLDSNLAAGQTTSGSLSAQISSGSQTPTQPPEQQKPNTQLPEQQKPNTQPPKQEAPKAEAPADSPKTGDSSRIGWTVVMILAAAGLLIYAGRKGSWKKGSALMLSLICVGYVFLSAGINAKAASTSAVGIAKISVDGQEEIIQVTVSWGVEPQDVHLQIEVQVDESTTAPVTLDLRKDGSYEAGLFVNGVLLTVQGEYTMSANGDLTFTSPENNAVATVLLADPPYEGGKGTVPCTATQQADGSYSILLGNEECKLHVAIIPGFLELDWPFNYEFVLSADEAARLPVTE